MNISVKGQAPVQRLAQNAADLGITPKQLEKLLQGVQFDGLLGVVSSASVKSAFAGAAEQLVLAERTRMPKALDRITAISTGAEASAALREVGANGGQLKNVSERYNPPLEQRDRRDEFSLIIDRANEMPMADAVAVVTAALSEITRQAAQRQMSVSHFIAFDRLSNVCDGLKERNIAGADAETIRMAAAACHNALDRNAIRAPNGQVYKYGASSSICEKLASSWYW